MASIILYPLGIYNIITTLYYIYVYRMYIRVARAYTYRCDSIMVILKDIADTSV